MTWRWKKWMLHGPDGNAQWRAASTLPAVALAPGDSLVYLSAVALTP